MPQLTKALVRQLPKNGPTDPILYYRRPLVGWLFRERINLGLRLLPVRSFDHVVEVGYGAGAVLLTLASGASHLHGLDLDADPEPVHAILGASGHRAELVKGSVYEMPFPSGLADLVVCFSVFEHLSEYRRGLREVRRILRPGGLFLLGMPAVNRMMEAGFRAIGFKGVEHHHVTTPAAVADAFGEAGFRVVKKQNLSLPIPGFLTIYYNWLLEAA
jgi:ubiquinone/menaquinone biosynthesis C-methylase UbiE